MGDDTIFAVAFVGDIGNGDIFDRQLDGESGFDFIAAAVAVAVNVGNFHIVDIAGIVSAAVTVTGIEIDQMAVAFTGIGDIGNFDVVHFCSAGTEHDDRMISSGNFQIADLYVMEIAGVITAFEQFFQPGISGIKVVRFPGGGEFAGSSI